MRLRALAWQRDKARLPQPMLQNAVRRLGEQLFSLMETARAAFAAFQQKGLLRHYDGVGNAG